MYPSAPVRSGPVDRSAVRRLGDASLAIAAFPGADGPLTVTRKSIPDGDAGARATVSEMARLIDDGSVHPIVRGQAIAIASGAPERDYDRQIQLIRAWACRHVVFLRDPTNQELLHEPAVMVASIARNPGGVIHVDCDDVAILTGALGMAIGLLCRIVTVAFRDPSADALDDADATSLVPAWLRGLTGFDATTPFAHTWAELSSPIGSPRWVDMDTTRSAQGVDPSMISRTFIVDV